MSLDNRHYGYRRITVLLKRTGWLVNHKRVQPPTDATRRGTDRRPKTKAAGDELSHHLSASRARRLRGMFQSSHLTGKTAQDKAHA